MSLSSPAPDLVEASTGCPDEMDLIAWQHGTLADQLGSSARDRIAAHLRTCSLCRATLADGAQHRDESADGAGQTAPDGAGDAGTRFAGRYELRGELGRGATSIVFRAFDVWTKTEVALKRFTGRIGTRVGHELALGRRMLHPNVCRVFDVGEADGQSYLTMELIVGETLAARLRQRQTRTTLDPVPMLTQVVQGLAAAHAAGVVHRDLKPDNILVGDDGRVVLTDFGLARLEDAEESRARLVGTPSTWAPEQARGERATTASDVFSLGVVLYPWLAGRSFQLSDERAFEALPARYRSWFERCLAARPRDRFHHAQDAAEAWSRLHARSVSAVPRALGAIAACVVLAVVAAFAWRARTSHVGGSPGEVGGAAGVSAPASSSLEHMPDVQGTPAAVGSATSTAPRLDPTTPASASAGARRTTAASAGGPNGAHAGVSAQGSTSSTAPASTAPASTTHATASASTARPLSTLLYRQ